jgi:formylglycine-generating enzyme required for sulfatase activity
MYLVAAGNMVVDLVLIPSGEFWMGSNNQFFSEAPAHRVRIPAGFFLGKYPITQAQWLDVMRDNPSTFPVSPEHPVDFKNFWNK